MKSLYNVICESILDDDFVASISTKAWIDKYLSEGSYKMTNDGVILITGSHVLLTIENNDLPEGLKFDGQYSLTLKSCTNVDMNAFQGSIVYEVVVYCASGSFGRSNGVSRDVVLGFTPKMVKTKNNGNRPSKDICILRPHHIAKDFFDK